MRDYSAFLDASLPTHSRQSQIGPLMTADYVILCDDVGETADGMPTLVGIADDRSLSDPSSSTKAIWFFARLRGTPGVTATVASAWVAPCGRKIRETRQELQVGSRGFSYWWGAMHVVFAQAGAYRYELRVGSLVIASADLQIMPLLSIAFALP